MKNLLDPTRSYCTSSFEIDMYNDYIDISRNSVCRMSPTIDFWGAPKRAEGSRVPVPRRGDLRDSLCRDVKSNIYWTNIN